MILRGQAVYDEARLAAALTRICEQHIDMFGAPLPMESYLFVALRERLDAWLPA